jgi:hypothetical protein
MLLTKPWQRSSTPHPTTVKQVRSAMKAWVLSRWRTSLSIRCWTSCHHCRMTSETLTCAVLARSCRPFGWALQAPSLPCTLMATTTSCARCHASLCCVMCVCVMSTYVACILWLGLPARPQMRCKYLVLDTMDVAHDFPELSEERVFTLPCGPTLPKA